MISWYKIISMSMTQFCSVINIFNWILPLFKNQATIGKFLPVCLCWSLICHWKYDFGISIPFYYSLLCPLCSYTYFSWRHDLFTTTPPFFPHDIRIILILFDSFTFSSMVRWILIQESSIQVPGYSSKSLTSYFFPSIYETQSRLRFLC